MWFCLGRYEPAQLLLSDGRDGLPAGAFGGRVFGPNAPRHELSKDIPERSVPSGAVAGTNDFRKREYGGPMPPSGVHRYCFKLFALDTTLKLSVGSNRAALDRAMQGHVLAQGQLMGQYSRKKTSA